nr:zinc finger, CCHC-type [Tanacetum cinerariifolium]
MEVEPLNETQLEDLGLSTCNQDIPLGSREIPSFDESEPQPKPLANCLTLDVSLGNERGPKPPIKPHSFNSFKMKVVDSLTIHTPLLPHVASFHPKDIHFYYHTCIDDLKKHYEFKLATIEDAIPICILGDYSKPSHEGYKNTIKLPVGNNVVPFRYDTIRLVQNGSSFYERRSEDPNQHLKDFLKLVDSLDLDGENKERTRLRLFKFSLHDQASNWLERLLVGSITAWEDLTTCFIAQFFPPGRILKLRNDILMFQQHQGESLSEAWTHFKNILQKVPHHGIDLWLQV